MNCTSFRIYRILILFWSLGFLLCFYDVFSHSLVEGESAGCSWAGEEELDTQTW